MRTMLLAVMLAGGFSSCFSVERFKSPDSSLLGAVDTTQTAPAGPKTLIAVAGDAEVTLTWDAVDGALLYSMYFVTGEGFDAARATRINPVTSPFVHHGLNNGSAYAYAVAAMLPAGESLLSSVAIATPTSHSPPGAPSDVVATKGDQQVTISFTAVSGLTYKLYRSTTSPVDLATASSVDATSSPVTQLGLSNGLTYYYVLVASNGYGSSPPSAQVSATPLPPPPSPPAITSIMREAGLDVSWSASGGASSYNFYWSAQPISAGVGVTKVSGITLLKYNVTSVLLAYKQHYYFAVSAVGEGGEGALSPEASVQYCPLDPPAEFDPTTMVLASASYGQDLAGDGVCLPYATIAHAFVQLGSRTSVFLANGIYGAYEAFPITVPDGKELRGLNVPIGTIPQAKIEGSVASGNTTPLGIVTLGTGSRLAHVDVHNQASAFSAAVLVNGQDAQILQVRTQGNFHGVILNAGASAGMDYLAASYNTFSGVYAVTALPWRLGWSCIEYNGNIGIHVEPSASSSATYVVNDSVVHGNHYDVFLGGSASSYTADLTRNTWAHSPPNVLTVGPCTGTCDIYNNGSAGTVSTGSSSVVAADCSPM